VSRIVKKSNYADQTEQAIREAIVRGELASGSRHSVDSLLERLDLGVSRTPVREALLRLAESGMVHFEGNQGVRILERDAADLQELFELRLMLEVPGAYHAAKGTNQEVRRYMQRELDMMQSVAGETEQLGADEVPNSRRFQELMVAFLKHDKRFHELVLMAAGNRRLVRLVNQMRDFVTMEGAITLGYSRKLTEVAAEHIPILTAIEKKDSDAAAAAMYWHLWDTGGLLVKRLGKETDAHIRPRLTLPWFDQSFPKTLLERI
jgi:DNA-binding GntR family transcriptional regulator